MTCISTSARTQDARYARLDGRDYCMGGSGLLGFKTVSRRRCGHGGVAPPGFSGAFPPEVQTFEALMQDGPILLGMRIYQDFYAYESGMGFGPGYVLAVNSWSTSWGMNGAFKVKPQAVDFGFFLPGRPLGTFAGSSYPMPLPKEAA
eukprot:Skav232407  [mRNA]  locus=scaffold1077:813542:819834:- [translate_table: standard]